MASVFLTMKKAYMAVVMNAPTTRPEPKIAATAVTVS